MANSTRWQDRTSEKKMQVTEVIEFLIQAGNSAPSADNTQPWCFRREADDLVLAYDAARFPDSMFPFDHPATLLTMGAAVENLVMAWTALGMSRPLTPVIPVEAPYEFLRMPLCSSQLAAAPSALPWKQRHTNRLPFRKDAINDIVAMPLDAAGSNEVSVRVIENRKTIGRIARLVRAASETRFRTREIHDWFSQSLRFTPVQVARGDGLDVATFDLPPGGRTLLKIITSSWRNMQRFNRVGGYKVLAAAEAASIVNAGAILALCGPADVAGAFAAGRRMQAVWIALNAAGLAVQPYYVVSDQLTRLENDKVPKELRPAIGALKKETALLFALAEGTTLHLLLRVGKPRKNAVRALRLPVSQPK